MSKLIVRGGLPGFVRVEVEGGEGVDIDTSKPVYTALQEVQPFLQALLDAAAAPEVKKTSLRPKADT